MRRRLVFTRPGPMSFFAELQRRNVFRVGVAYAVAVWVFLQVLDLVMEYITAPVWIMHLTMMLLAAGFPAVLIGAWLFEVTPEGLKLEREVERSRSITRETGRKLDRMVIVFLAVAVVFLLADRFTFTDTESANTPGPASSAITEEPYDGAVNNEPSIAVLPFLNMSEDQQNAYFSDGISEELLNVLVRIEGLRVPSRTSSFSFRDSRLKVSEIGRELDVDHVLEGSVRKDGNRIRVTAQLIDVGTDTHLWSETYTRELDDIFAVQDEIAHAIVGALKVTLSGKDEQILEQRPTDNIEAYNLYLKGRHHWSLRIPGRMSEAIEPLEKATSLDPEFDEAWAALADVYLLLPEYSEGTPDEHIPRALAATARALEINPESAHALTTSAYIKAMYQYQWQEAEAGFLRAIELEPNDVTAHQWYAEMLSVQGRLPEALEQLALAEKIDPLAPIIPHIRGWIFNWDDQLEPAEEAYLAALSLDPGFPYAISNLAQVYMRTGALDMARARWTEFHELQDTPGLEFILTAIDAMEDPSLTEQVVSLMPEVDFPTDPFNAPFLLMLLGRHELALETLVKHQAQNGAYAVHVNRMKIFDPIRDDPRFRHMLEEMNLLP